MTARCHSVAKWYFVLQICLYAVNLDAWGAPLGERVVGVGVRTHSGAEAGFEKWGPTVDYLSEAVPGYRFVMIPHSRIDKQMRDAVEGAFQFVLTNPATYIELAHRHQVRALLTLVNNRQGSAQTRFGSVIFTRAERGDILELSDLRNKRVMAVSPLGFGGWRAAWREMSANGIDPFEDFRQMSFAGGEQPRVIDAVREGRVDAGVVRTDMLERLADAGKIDLREFRVINNIETEGFPFFHSTPLYPEWPFAVMPGVEQELVDRVTRALLEIKPDHAAARAGKYFGWTQALDYQSVDDLLRELGEGPHAMAERERRFAPLVGLLALLVVAGLLLVLWRTRTARGRRG